MNFPPFPGRVAILLLAGLLICAGDASAEKEAATSEAIVYRADLVYGRVHGAGLLADIAYPKAKPDARVPAIISVHGGRWIGGHKRDGSTIKVKQWAGFGFFAMSIDYRLVIASKSLF